MDRSSLLRIVLIAALGFLAIRFLGPGLGFGGKENASQNLPPETYVDAPGFAPDEVDPLRPGQTAPVAPPEGTLCTINGDRFDAILSTRGAALTHFYLRDPHYAGTEGLDISTTTQERWRSLRTLFRGDNAYDQVKFDRFDWKLAPPDGASCKFSYEDEAVRIEKVVSKTARPFELDIRTTVTNLSAAPHRHAFSIQEFAYRKNKDPEDNKNSLFGFRFGRVSPLTTELSCARSDEVKRKSKSDFKEGWFSEPLDDRYVALSNAYFAQALIPNSAPDNVKPECDILAEDWFSSGQKKDDDDAGAVYHGRLAYPSVELQPQASATYTNVAFFGPKERAVLAKADDGKAHLGDLINLGFFSPVAKVLVGVLVFFHAHVTGGNWGFAIVAMTVSLRLLLLPLSIKPVRTSIAMRKLKPEIDAIGAKYKDDAQAKNMATMELYRKHGVNPLGGCLPQLVQMPIWFAMYTTLQTAVEMYHEKFLWFSDLSAPDRFFILPFIIGGFQMLQMRIVPQQGMDPVQAKMMMYLMPTIFTVMMLFLPAALGVYMLTSNILGIAQQLVIERIAPRGGPTPRGEITVKTLNKDDEGGPLSGTFGKGKARV